MTLEGVWLVVAALLPTVGVGFLFYVVIRAMLEADRRERLAHSQWLARHDDPTVNSSGTDTS